MGAKGVTGATKGVTKGVTKVGKGVTKGVAKGAKVTTKGEFDKYLGSLKLESCRRAPWFSRDMIM